MIKYKTGSAELIDNIEPLWNKQREYHSNCSTYFGDELTEISYSKRKQSFLTDGKELFITITKDENQDIGYIVTSFTENKGEIESLYVDDNYRGKNIGYTLMEKSLNWLKENNIENIEIYVAVGNETVHDFYRNFGFYPKVTKLVRKK